MRKPKSSNAITPGRIRKDLLFIILSSVLLFQGPSLIAQEVHLGCQWGKAAYNMEHLKSYEKLLVSRMPGAKQKVADYPPYWFYKPTLSVNWYHVSLWMALGYHSSGSRYSLIDYSGEYRFDTRIKGNTVGTAIKLKLNPGHLVHISLYSEVGLIHSKVSMMEYFEVDEQVLIDEELKSKATNYYMEPGVELSCPVSIFIVAFQAGYSMQFGGNALHGNYYGEEFELKDYKNPVKAEWQGYRISGSLSLNLSRLFTAKEQ